MRPLLLAFLARHGLPEWLAPDYFSLVALSSIAGFAIALRLTRRDGADSGVAVRALLLAYVAALLGGYVFEVLRAVPSAIAAGSLAPLARVGRAAYGGLLGAILASALYLRRQGQPLGAFFDRVSVGAGIVFAAVRTGCFLSGCDYGVPTALPLGVRFPPGSLAAIDHLQRGWVPAGAPSLPVHPTELYEAAVGGFGAVVAALVLARRPQRDGTAFLCWLSIYAAGRFAVELLRGDAGRGRYLGLSTAQYVSLALLSMVGIIALRGARFRSLHAASLRSP